MQITEDQFLTDEDYLALGIDLNRSGKCPRCGSYGVMCSTKHPNTLFTAWCLECGAQAEVPFRLWESDRDILIWVARSMRSFYDSLDGYRTPSSAFDE
jgi:hypothetical protein